MGVKDIVPYVGVEEVKNWKALVPALVAEMIGTLLLVLIGCGSCYGNALPIRYGLCFGITVATIAQSIGHVSGCHINPAVTFGLFFGRKIGLIKSILYIVVQSVGGLIGAALLKAVMGAVEYTEGDNAGETIAEVGVGTTGLNKNISVGQGFGIEYFITFVLVLVVYASAADENNEVKGSAPLAIGLSIATCHLFAGPLTGSSMNPARTLGSNVVFGKTENLWLYWVGPILGGITAGLLYQLVFKAPEPEEANKQSYELTSTKDTA